jgi:hypothetical protein
MSNLEYSTQAIRSSGSVGANYNEANEALSKKGFHSANQDMSEGSEGDSLLTSTHIL